LTGESHRDSALKLLSLMISAYGVEWLYAGCGGRDDMFVFLMLAVHLSCVEVQMILEEHSLANVSALHVLQQLCVDNL